MIIRNQEKSHQEFLYDMCYEAVYYREGEKKPSKEEILSEESILKYVKNFGGTASDAGVVAFDETGEPVGAAWYRLFDYENRGYGFISEDIPELSIAIKSEFRGRGLGTKLLQCLIEKAKAEGYPAISLSVDPDNPAVRVYEKLGFEMVGVCGTSWTMKLDLK